MNDAAFNLLGQSVANRSVTNDDRLLESLRITRNKELPSMQFLFRIFGKPCFPRGELVAVTGKAKSGKTLFNSLLMACCIREEVLQIQRPFEDVDGSWQCPPIRCLWYDTEQSEQSTQDILKNRILPLTGCTEATEATDFDIFNVRSLHYEERLLGNDNKPHPKKDELFYEALKAGPLFYSDMQARVQKLLNCGTDMWNNMFREMRDSGAIIRTKNKDGKAVWQLPPVQPETSKPQPVQPDMFDQAAAVSGDSPSS